MLPTFDGCCLKCRDPGDRGGMKTYATMHKYRPDVFIHSGDTTYADGPFSGEKELADGTLWKNVTTPETSKVAETIDEFRANWKYNMLDDNVRAFNNEVPIYYQRDDHETLNNWYPGESLAGDERHAGTLGPGDMDNTFGTQVKCVKAPTKEQGQNLPPSMGLQFFGVVTIDPESEDMRVSLRDVADEEFYAVTLQPERSAG